MNKKPFNKILDNEKISLLLPNIGGVTARLEATDVYKGGERGFRLKRHSNKGIFFKENTYKEYIIIKGWLPEDKSFDLECNTYINVLAPLRKEDVVYIKYNKPIVICNIAQTKKVKRGMNKFIFLGQLNNFFLEKQFAHKLQNPFTFEVVSFKKNISKINSRIFNRKK